MKTVSLFVTFQGFLYRCIVYFQGENLLSLLKNLSTCMSSTAVSLLTVTAVNIGVNYD